MKKKTPFFVKYYIFYSKKDWSVFKQKFFTEIYQKANLWIVSFFFILYKNVIPRKIKNSKTHKYIIKECANI